jgi:hypothetical protein
MKLPLIAQVIISAIYLLFDFPSFFIKPTNRNLVMVLFKIFLHPVFVLPHIKVVLHYGKVWVVNKGFLVSIAGQATRSKSWDNLLEPIVSFLNEVE